MSLVVENVTKMYGQQKALDAVSFHVNRGEVLALLGPNGAGKSTMMKIIACYLSQNAGKVTVCGFDVSRQTLEVKKRVGYLPENNPLYLDMYVKEYLRFVAGIYRLGRKLQARVDEMIELTGLTTEYKKTIGALSKGYRQRVGLAQALIHNPEVLILDEPTSGLDPNQLADIRALIKDIGKEKTVILSTHIMQEVEAVCNRVIIVDKGNIMADSPTDELRLLNRAGKQIVVEFDQPPDIEKIKDIDGVVDVIMESKNCFRIISQGVDDVRPAIFRFAVDQGLTILELYLQEGSLEQVFREVTV
jgi:ABC-2 type transport system ATP-binding protein